MQTKRTKLFSVLLTLAMLLSLLPAGTIPVVAAEGTAYYVSSSGSDANDGKSEDKPFATLAKAVDAAEDGSTIYVTSDLTMTACARFYDKSLTITSLGDTAHTISRGDSFDTQSDGERSWYNPAMIEVQTTNAPAGLTLTNIILDDADKHEGTVFAQATTIADKASTEFVQDAMIASNATYPTTITLGDGAVLRNFGGMSAVRVTDKAKLVMESGSVIEDVLEGDNAHTTRTKGKVTGEVGPAGAVWIQGASFEMKAGAKIQNVDGRAVYVDGGSATIGGTISGIKANANMWQGKGGVALHLRNDAEGTLTETSLIEGVSGGGSAISTSGCDLTVRSGSIIRNITGTIGIAVGGDCEVYFDGELTGMVGTANALNLQNAEFHVTIGENANIHDNQVGYGTVYIQAKNGKLDIYGKINNNIASDRGGAIAMSNNFEYPTIVTMYEGAEIIGNSSTTTGGGIMVTVGTFTMKGGTISGNTAGDEGGGVYVRRGGQFIMEGGTISNNHSKEYGGGIAYVASNYNDGVPYVSLKNGTITGNTMGDPASKVSNDLGISSSKYSYINRYFFISDDVTIGNKAVYFEKGPKTVTPADNSFDIKLGNANDEANAALQVASTAKGWGAPLATFWAQRDGAATLTVGGLTLNDGLPVYVLTVPVDAEDGKPTVTEAKCYAADRTTDGVQFTIPAADLAEGGCAIGIVQPTENYGTLTISGDESITEDETAESYPVNYTVTYAMSENLASIIAESNEKTASYRLTLSPDAKLTGTVDTSSFDGTADFTANYTLPKDEFAANESLFASAVLTVTVDGKDYVIPSNVAETKMLPLVQHTVNFDLNGGSGSIASVTVNHGDALGDQMPADPSRSGYRFLGWNTQPNGSGDSFTKDTAVNADVTLYAQWARRPVAPSSSGSVSDLNSADHVAYVHGYDDGTVRPNANITRAATAAMLYRLLTPERRAEIYSTSNSFSDVTAADWCNEAVSTMTRGGYIGGFKDGTFGGSRSITRAQFVAILVRFVGVDDSTCSFTDVPTSHWAYEYIATATANNWIGGYKDGSFKPDQLITRAQAMAIINRVLNRGVDENSELLNCRIWPDISEEDWYYYEVIEATNGHEYTGSRPSENWTKLLNS